MIYRILQGYHRKAAIGTRDIGSDESRAGNSVPKLLIFQILHQHAAS